MFSNILTAGFALLLGLALLVPIRIIYTTVILPLVNNQAGATDFEKIIFSAIPLAALVVVFATPVLMVIGRRGPFSRGKDE